MIIYHDLMRKIIGKLLYVSTNSRPDISLSVGSLAQRVEKPRKLDLNEALRVKLNFYFLQWKIVEDLSFEIIFLDENSKAGNYMLQSTDMRLIKSSVKFHNFTTSASQAFSNSFHSTVFTHNFVMRNIT
ncbi:CLUMA_CG008014, isoform A [Clunio marinus]|uniref:CLUMA_CG008014, isoform A n=1 Tax=Clunio marinus TaxID=568069 RepID=A0A1J1I2J9_9DIPT|nr:CLUMA_CG008014, isoform A [Clunio marinus]